MIIYGAGLAGLLAANQFQNAKILEANPETNRNHKALLRFRTNAVGDSAGVDFKKVTVRKGIHYNGRFCKPNIMLANYYSKKVIGKLANRSIWNIDTVERYIAPQDFIEILIDRAYKRIEWNTKVTSHIIKENKNTPQISTMPMSAIEILTANKLSGVEFKNAPIKVKRWIIPDCDVYQTIYYPNPYLPIYRASITGNMLIAEFVELDIVHEDDWGMVYSLESVEDSFGIRLGECDELGEISQSFGKIAPIDEQFRKSFIHNLTINHNIYSLGRFGTWRNILLDDVIKDICVIKKLVSNDSYTLKLSSI